MIEGGTVMNGRVKNFIKGESRIVWILFFFFLCMVLLLWLPMMAKKLPNEEEHYEDFTKQEILRFHIRAQDDTKREQDKKMQVKEAVLSYVRLQIKANSKQELKKEILKRRSSLEKVIDAVLRQDGKSGKVSIYATKEFFPMRKYGKSIMPAGIYEAIRIDLGKGRGKNWWCILYPQVCLIDPNLVLEEKEDKKYLNELFRNKPIQVRYKSFFLSLNKAHGTKDKYPKSQADGRK